MAHDYYEILQVSSNADIEIIKVAFKRLALKYHPDTGKENASIDKMRLLIEAYETLSDENKRRAYDLIRQRDKLVEDQLQEARRFIDLKMYVDAKAILSTVAHPTARQLLVKVNSLIEQQHDQLVVSRIQEARKLIDRKLYEEAKAILSPVDHPTARQLLVKVNSLIEQQKAFSFTKKEKIKPPFVAPSISSPQDRFEATIAHEVHSIRSQTGLPNKPENQQKADQLISERNKHLFHLLEREKMLIAVYQEVGSLAFQWRIYPQTGERKLKAWNCIIAGRYEEAKYIIDRWLLSRKPFDQDIYDWNVLIVHILGNEARLEALERLSYRGVANYPIKIVWRTMSIFGCLLFVLPPLACTLWLWTFNETGVFWFFASIILLLYAIFYRPEYMK